MSCSRLLLLAGPVLILCACVTNAEPPQLGPNEVTRAPQLAQLPEVAEGAVELSVRLEEWQVLPETRSVSAGAVTFELVNRGLIPHQLSVLRTDRPSDELPVVEGRADAASTSGAASAEPLVPGTHREWTVRLLPGDYVLLCNLPAHYEASMRTALTVQ